MENIVVKKRESNIELLRIIAMFMVTVIHCIDNGLILKNIHELSLFNFISISFLRVVVGIANGIFLLITGYYQINSKFKLSKIINLWGRTLFYSIGIMILVKLLGYKVSYLESLFPISTGVYWFISAYIALYLFAPIINLVLNKLSKNQFKYLVILCLCLFGIFKIIFLTDVFNGIFFSTLVFYILGAYIRKFFDIQTNKSYFTKYILFTILTTCIYIILFAMLRIITKGTINIAITKIYINFLDFSNILFIIMTVLLFLKIKSINIKSIKINRFINFIAPSMLSIYIIQQNVHLRSLWRIDGAMNYGKSFFMIPYMLILVISVFAISLLIDIIRRIIFTALKRTKIGSKLICIINDKLSKLNTCINNYIS